MLTKKSIKIIPAILSESIDDFKYFALLFEQRVNTIHLDIMDGHFVEAESPSLDDLSSLIQSAKAQFWLHLMHNKPKEALNYAKLHKNVKGIYFHFETNQVDIDPIAYDFEIGIALNPETNIDDNFFIINRFPVVLIMTVHPGVQGGQFLPETLKKISRLRELGYQGEIHIDGHVNEATLPKIILYSPDVVCIGSAIQKSLNPLKSMNNLEKLVEQLTFE